MKKPFVLFALFLILALSFWSCQNDRSPIEPESFSENTTLNKGDLKVFLELTVVDGLSSSVTYDLNILKVADAWKEIQVTWNNRNISNEWIKPGGDYFENPVVEYPVTTDKSLKIDITDLFLDGVPKNGLLLKVKDYTMLNLGQRIKIFSKEKPKNTDSHYADWVPPQIVVVTKNGEKTFPITADAELLAADAFKDMNFGSKPALYVGYPDSDAEVRSILNFDIPADIIPPTEACTHTKAYWKTHAKGKKKDPAWDLIEPDGKKTKFFKSQKSYYKVLWNRPRRGNVYYLLAYEYIAAELNKLNGAEFSEIKGAFDKATELFEEYAPKKTERLRKNNDLRKQFLELAKELRSYNTGEIGPGHCDDFKWHKKDKEWEKWWKKKWGKKP